VNISSLAFGIVFEKPVDETAAGGGAQCLTNPDIAGLGVRILVSLLLGIRR
jgi:hypothetical protein